MKALYNTLRAALSSAVVALLLLSPSTLANAQKYLGGDISLLPSYEEKGAKYYNTAGESVQPFQYFQDCKWNAMRVRLFVDPSKAPSDDKNEGVCQDLAYVTALGQRIKAAGLAFMLDIHYSDTWTDPGQHTTPSGWPATASELADRVYSYTVDVLSQLKAAGATPDFIQPGNEITYGMLWPTGHVYPGGGAASGGSWANFANYMNKAIKACREQCPAAKIVIQSELHSASLALQFYTTLRDNGVTDWDVIGLSYYPAYHGTLSTLQGVLNNLTTAWPTKKIQIVETGLHHKWYPTDNSAKPASSFPTWLPGGTASDAGQCQFAKDLVALLNQYSNVDGLYWWFPEANECGVDSNSPVTPSGWYNASLFDNENGCARSAILQLPVFLGLPALTEASLPTDKMYVVGNGESLANWDITAPKEMTAHSDGSYTFTFTAQPDAGATSVWLCFTQTVLTTADWNAFNGIHRIGPAAGTKVAKGNTYTMSKGNGDTSFEFPSGSYTITVKPTAADQWSLTVSDAAAIENISQNLSPLAPVYDLQGRKVRTTTPTILIRNNKKFIGK